MELRPPTEPTNDPFFAAVRHRHPEVDIVLLPPPEPPAPAQAAGEVTHPGSDR
ncbi:MAG: hypothetical protein M3237_16320 [Actinomycetota bacterium]|nr:hypothetical protein [Actinomycetota bacterium]